MTADTASEPDLRGAAQLDAPPFNIVTGWLRAGLADFRANMALSLVYGTALAAAGWAVVALLVSTGLGYMLLPAIGAGLLVGPIAVLGLYRVARGGAPDQDGGQGTALQVVAVSVILAVIALIWFRVAAILFALFFGTSGYAGPVDALGQVFLTANGLGMLLVGTAFGAVFAAACFAISAFSLPMLLDRRLDAFTAIVLSANGVCGTPGWGSPGA